MSISKKMAASAIVAASIVGVGAVAWAQEGGSRPSLGHGSDPTPAAAAAGRVGARAGLLGRVEHGDLIVRTKNGFQPVTMDRGRVTAASASSVTVARPDGTSVTVTIDGTTKFRGITSAADLVTGKAAVVLSHDGTALVVGQGRRNAK